MENFKRSILTLLTLSLFCLSRGGVLDTGELHFLGKNLKSQECWALGNFLAQKTWDPLEASAEMTKAGGHSSVFQCQVALDFWAKALLPQSIEKMGKGQSYGEEILDKGLRFVNRADLVPHIQKFRPSKQVVGSEEEEVDILPDGENSLDHNKVGPGHAGHGAMEQFLSRQDFKGVRPQEATKNGLKKPFLGAQSPSDIESEISVVPNPTPGRVALGLIIGFITILLLILVVAAIHSCLRARGAMGDVDLEGPMMDVTSDVTFEHVRRQDKSGSGTSGSVLYDQTGSPVILDTNANDHQNHNKSPGS